MFPFDVIFILGLVVILNLLKCEKLFDCGESDGNSSQSDDNQCNFMAPTTPKTLKKVKKKCLPYMELRKLLVFFQMGMS